MRFRVEARLVFAFALSAAWASAQVRPEASSASTPTRRTSSTPAVSSDAAGTSSWSGRATDQDGDGAGVFGQRYDASGAPTGPSSRSTPTRRRPRPAQRGIAMPPAPSWWSGGTLGGRPASTGSSPSATTRRAPREAASFGSTSASLFLQQARRSRRTRPATSSWRGRASAGGSRSRVFAQRFDASGRPAERSSRSTPTRPTRTGDQGPPSPRTRPATSS